MTLDGADIVVMAAYFFFLVFFGYLTRRTSTFNEFAVGKQSVPALMVFASLAATIVGPGFSIGFASKGWTSGYLYYYLAIAYSVQVVAVGLFLAPRLAHHRDCISIGDIMRKKYGSFCRFLAGVVSVGLCIGFTAVMGKVAGSVLHAVSGWPEDLCLIVVTGVTALVTFSGGLRATVATEGLQFSVKSIAVSLFLVLAVIKAPASLGSMAAKANMLTMDACARMSGLQIFGTILSFMVGEALIPPYVNRALAAKSEQASRIGFVGAGVFCLMWLSMVTLLGVAAHDYLPSETVGDEVFVTLAQRILPSGMFGLLLAAVIAIVMGSQESVLNSSSVAFVRDVVGVFHSFSERGTLILAKGTTLVFAGVAIYAAHFAPSIIDGLLLMYSIWAPSILIPLILALYVKDTKPAAGYLSVLAGGGTALVWQTVLHEPDGIPTILIGLAAGATAYAAGHFLSPRVLADTEVEA